MSNDFQAGHPGPSRFGLLAAVRRHVGRFGAGGGGGVRGGPESAKRLLGDADWQKTQHVVVSVDKYGMYYVAWKTRGTESGNKNFFMKKCAVL